MADNDLPAGWEAAALAGIDEREEREGRLGETDGEVMARLGTDAAKWAAEFARVADALGRVSGPARERTIAGLATEPAPGELLHVWFVNAIEAGRTAGQRDVSAMVSRVRSRLLDADEFQRLDEAVRREAQRRLCASEDHRPVATTVSGQDGRVLRYFCRCGEQSWIPA